MLGKVKCASTKLRPELRFQSAQDEAPWSLLRRLSSRQPSKTMLPFLYETSTMQRRSIHIPQEEDPEDPWGQAVNTYLSDAPRGSNFERSPARGKNARRSEKNRTFQFGGLVRAVEIDTVRPLNPSNSRQTAHRPPIDSVEALEAASPKADILDGYLEHLARSDFRIGRPSLSKKQPGEDDEVPAGYRRNTMTNLELNAFTRLFDSLTPKHAKTGRQRGEDRDELEDVKREIEDEDGNLNYVDMADLLTNDEELQAPIIERYPETIKDMAIRAQREAVRDKQLRSREDQTPGKPREDQDRFFMKLRKETKRIQQRFVAAATDVELWTVLEEEIFARLRRLSLDGKTEDEIGKQKENGKGKQTTRKKKQASSKKAVKSTDHVASTLSMTASTEPDPKDDNLVFLSWACAPLILIAIRAFCRRTVTAPFPLAVLPTLKSISLSAYVLGASTAVYNELLSYQWRLYYDMDSIISLLQEMVAAGFLPNAQTLGILRQIQVYRADALKGKFGEAVKAVESMSLRQTEEREIRKWSERIRAQFWEQALERQRGAETMERMKEEGLFEDEDERANVERERPAAIAAAA